MANRAAGAAVEALGDSTRRAVFELLKDGPRSVGEIASHLPVSRPAVSQHLKVLKGAQLVRDTAQGTRRLYEIDASGLAELRSYVEGFWGLALTSYKAAAERPAKGERWQRRRR